MDLADMLNPETYMDRARERRSIEGHYVKVGRKQVSKFGIGAACPTCYKSMSIGMPANAKAKHLCQCGNYATQTEVLEALGLIILDRSIQTSQASRLGVG